MDSHFLLRDMRAKLGALEERAKAILTQYSGFVDKDMKSVMNSRKDVGFLYDMMRYHLGWVSQDFRSVPDRGGKKLRPGLCLLTSKAISMDFSNAVPVASAIEVVHNFSLIHDDIEDSDVRRRDRPTLWRLWGIPQAINTGDGMLVLANLTILRLLGKGIELDKTIEIVRILNETIITMVEGQHQDLDFESRTDVDVEEYLEMIEKKTASLIECSTRLGAIVASDSEYCVNSFSDFGRNLGMGFQIADDILGIWEPSNLGKEGPSDILKRKKTLPVIHALSQPDLGERLGALYKKRSLRTKEIDEALSILDEAGSRKYATEMALDYLGKALESLPTKNLDQETTNDLLSVARFGVLRGTEV